MLEKLQMPVLSFRGLWPYLIATGYKDIENRKTLKNLRGWHLIHVSQKYEKGFDLNRAGEILTFEESYKFWDRLYELNYAEFSREIKTGCVIGACYISDVVANHSSKWAEKDCNNLVIDTEKSILFDKPIEGVKGKLSVWKFELPGEYREKYPQLAMETKIKVKPNKNVVFVCADCGKKNMVYYKTFASMQYSDTISEWDHAECMHCGRELEVIDFEIVGG